MLSTNSCNPGEPFVKLDPTGQASILNYNLPTETCYDVYGQIGIKINPACFSAFANGVPPENFWDSTKNYSSNQVMDLINDEIVGSYAGTSILNAQAIQRLSLVIPKELKYSKSINTERVAQNQKLLKEDDAVSIAGMPLDIIVNQVLKGHRPIIKTNFYGNAVMSFLPRPKFPQPKITLVLHYKVCTFAAEYGAGKTVKTFSLLPGEQTTISITTFKHQEEKKSRAESILDSFSESSAQQFQQTIETQSGRDTTNSSQSANGSEISGGVNLSAVGVPVDVSGGVTNSSTTSNSITEHISAINNALNSQSSQASSNRDISVNTLDNYFG
jgi:hypothetical protein